jgi:hypothetical protein
MSRPGLPSLPLPTIPSIAFDVPIPLPAFDPSMQLPTMSRPGLPSLPLPTIPSIAFDVPIPPMACPLE